jgi:threonine synthase
VADPHSAIGYLGSMSTRVGEESAQRTDLFLATAHPAKFREVVERVIGTKVPLPGALAAALARPNRSTRISPTTKALINLL